MADVLQMYKDAFRRFAAGEIDVAIEAYQEVLRQDPSFALAYQGLSEAYARQGDLDAAIQAIRKAIELEPSEPLYLTSLSRFFQRQGKIPEAEEAAAQAARTQAQQSG